MKEPNSPSTTVKSSIPPATSMLLNGDPRKATRTIIFFPDGGGVSYSYIHLPLVSDTAISWGLNSPFVRSNEDMTASSVEEVAAAYLDEIKRIQPHGPYCFAGWSAGGIYAFRVTQMLVAEGEVVTEIAIIDSPCPPGLGNLEESFMKLCESTRLFGGRNPAPPWLMSHFRGSNYLLSKYDPEPLEHPPGLRKVSIMWATTGTFTKDLFKPSPEDTVVLQFLTRERADFGPGGWEKLLPNTPIVTKQAEGRNHFSLMSETFADAMGAFLVEAFESRVPSMISEQASKL